MNIIKTKQLFPQLKKNLSLNVYLSSKDNSTDLLSQCIYHNHSMNVLFNRGKYHLLTYLSCHPKLRMRNIITEVMICLQPQLLQYQISKLVIAVAFKPD